MTSTHSAVGIAEDLSKLYVRLLNGGLVLKVARLNSAIAVVKKKPAKPDLVCIQARASARLHVQTIACA